MTANSFDARSVLSAGGRDHEIYRLDVLGDDGAALPYSLKVLLENLLRKEDGDTVTVDDVRALVASQGDGAEREISFLPARVRMHRSEESRVGKEGVSTCRSRRTPVHTKIKKQ